jgi:hypothetical protein
MFVLNLHRKAERLPSRSVGLGAWCAVTYSRPAFGGSAGYRTALLAGTSIKPVSARPGGFGFVNMIPMPEVDR